MNPMDLFNQVKEMIVKRKIFDAAKKFVDDNKTTSVTHLGTSQKDLYLEMKMVSGALGQNQRACS